MLFSPFHSSLSKKHLFQFSNFYKHFFKWHFILKQTLENPLKVFWRLSNMFKCNFKIFSVVKASLISCDLLTRNRHPVKSGCVPHFPARRVQSVALSSCENLYRISEFSSTCHQSNGTTIRFVVLPLGNSPDLLHPLVLCRKLISPAFRSSRVLDEWNSSGVL